MKLLNIYQDLVNDLGGQTHAAKALGVTQPSVNAWLSGKTQMSAVIAVNAQSVTNGKYKAADLCPALKKFETAHQLAG